MELKELIKNTEERLISYKILLEDVGRNKTIFNLDNEWYKNDIRDFKNFEQQWLKKLSEEKRNENEGMNPPYCYKY